MLAESSAGELAPNAWTAELRFPRYVKRARRRFLFGLFDSVNPMAKIMTAELLGPEKAVIGMAFLPGETL